MNDAEKLNLPPLEGFDDPLWDDLEDERHYDRSGNPISMRDWVRLRQWDDKRGRQYTIVKQETIGDYFVSTVWIGLDHGFGYSEGPLIFETMVFRESTGESDLECLRYSTEEEAVEGHEKISAQARAIAELET